MGVGTILSLEWFQVDPCEKSRIRGVSEAWWKYERQLQPWINRLDN
jgi:hypothetical protein